MKIMKETQSLNPGDIVLCEDAVWPANDRFLNMLVLGPTGCGKSSQLAMSMIAQDIQNSDWGVTVLDPKGDLALKTHLLAQRSGRKSLYFDPTHKNCPKFNPLAGRESEVVENISEAFKLLNPENPQFFLDLNDQLLRNAVKVLKRLDKSEVVEGKYSTLIWLDRLLHNFGGQGRELVNNFAKINAPTELEAVQNRDIAQWFLNDYFPEHSKVYENTSGIRAQINKLVSNVYLRDILNPDFDCGEKNEINFDEILADGTVVCISTAPVMLRDLSKYLGYLINLTLQSSIRRRYVQKNVSHPHTLYLDEFYQYATPSFIDILSLSRPSRVSSVLLSHSCAEMGLGLGKQYVAQVLTRVRNIALYPGTAKKDVQYFANQLGFLPKEDVSVGGAGHGEIVYGLVQNGSVQRPRTGVINGIPEDLNNELEAAAAEYANEKRKREPGMDAAVNKAEKKESKISGFCDEGLPDLDINLDDLI